MKVVGYSQPQVKATPAPKADNGGDAGNANDKKNGGNKFFWNAKK